MPVIRAVRMNPTVVDRLDGLLGAMHAGASRIPMRRTDSPREYVPFFLIGAGRSGSTLARRLLMESHDVVVPPEMPHVGPLMRAFRRRRFTEWVQAVDWYLDDFRRRADVNIAREDHAGRAFDYNLWRTLDLDADVLRRSLLELPTEERSLGGMIRATYLASAGHPPGADRAWGDKTPYMTFHYTRILRAWPDARFVHLLRDGRDYVASYLEAQESHERQHHVRDVALRWRDAVVTCQRIAERVGDRFRIVRYEELVTEPEAVVASLGKFLRLPPRESPVAMSAEGLGDARMAHHRRIEEPVTARSVGKYEERLDEGQRAEALRLLGPTLASYGYLRNVVEPPAERDTRR